MKPINYTRQRVGSETNQGRGPALPRGGQSRAQGETCWLDPDGVHWYQLLQHSRLAAPGAIHKYARVLSGGRGFWPKRTVYLNTWGGRQHSKAKWAVGSKQTESDRTCVMDDLQSDRTVSRHARPGPARPAQDRSGAAAGCIFQSICGDQPDSQLGYIGGGKAHGLGAGGWRRVSLPRLARTHVLSEREARASQAPHTGPTTPKPA